MNASIWDVYKGGKKCARELKSKFVLRKKVEKSEHPAFLRGGKGPQNGVQGHWGKGGRREERSGSKMGTNNPRRG